MATLALILVADMVLRKKFPQLWERIQLPCNIITSVLSLILIVIIFVGTHQVVTSDMDTGNKVLFVLFAMVYIAAFVWANYSFWRRWLKKRKVDN